MAHPVTSTKNYTRQSLVIPASTPARGEEPSVRRSLHTPLRLSVHDYHVLGPTTAGLTVILTHGTSFNKYFWELVIDYLLSQPGARGKFKRFIALDAANHGDSALLNQGSLPETACWPDDSRDILHTLRVLKVEEPVVAIGHSFGGGTL